ncbi:hypothetical protein B0F87_11525 [Methylobacter tundripaludum]|uniref:Uncharacterized protein n=1 Tax=Methylobacter tundripaludum TaxID=173365 RepID=A0A2S6H666_9GAMM|nr:hypothetical protein B0F87_11525 [Methylobacter tundripaludum]
MLPKYLQDSVIPACYGFASVSVVGWVEYYETQRVWHKIWVSRCSTQPSALAANPLTALQG